MKKWLPVIVVALGATLMIGTLTLRQSRFSFMDSADMPEFCAWAFGEDWRETTSDMTNVPALWNERHGDLFTMRLTDRVDITTKRMYEAWKASIEEGK